MCELLGISFNRQIRPRFSFRGLSAKSDFHSDGWGLAYYPDQSKSAIIFKEPYPAHSSQLASFIESYVQVRSTVFIGHIRKSSIGSLSQANTHPFSRVYCQREWTFVHNGTLSNIKGIIEELAFLPLGQTDSENAFCILLTRMKEQRIKPSPKARAYTQRQLKKIHEILLDINILGDGPFNCIFSDSQNLFCYRDILGRRPLFIIKREYPFNAVTLRDSDLEVSLNIKKNDNEAGYIIASDKLTDEEWTPFQPGQMIVFRNGKIVADVI